MAGGKPKTDARTMAVKASQETRAQMAAIIFARIGKGKEYTDTTQAGVIRDAVALLHAKEVEGQGQGLTVPEEPKVPDTPVMPAMDLLQHDQQLKAEYDAFSQTEGVQGISWEHFLTIRKLRIQQGAWKYGPNQV